MIDPKTAITLAKEHLAEGHFARVWHHYCYRDDDEEDALNLRGSEFVDRFCCEATSAIRRISVSHEATGEAMLCAKHPQILSGQVKREALERMFVGLMWDVLYGEKFSLKVMLGREPTLPEVRYAPWGIGVMVPTKMAPRRELDEDVLRWTARCSAGLIFDDVPNLTICSAGIADPYFNYYLNGYRREAA